MIAVLVDQPLTIAQQEALSLQALVEIARIGRVALRQRRVEVREVTNLDSSRAIQIILRIALAGVADALVAAAAAVGAVTGALAAGAAAALAAGAAGGSSARARFAAPAKASSPTTRRMHVPLYVAMSEGSLARSPQDASRAK